MDGTAEGSAVGGAAAGVGAAADCSAAGSVGRGWYLGLCGADANRTDGEAEEYHAKAAPQFILFAESRFQLQMSDMMLLSVLFATLRLCVRRS